MPKISKDSSWEEYKKQCPISQEEKRLRKRHHRRRIFTIVSAIVCSIGAIYFGYHVYTSGKPIKLDRNFVFGFVAFIADIISIYLFILARKPTETRQRQKKVKEHYTDRLPKYFVDVHCQDINPGDDTDKHPVRQSLRKKVWEWLFDPQQKKWRYLQLLGDFGTGKTTFCFYLGQEIIATMLSLDVEIIELGTENLDLQDKLAKITDREKTILMLDAYDEYRKRGRADNEFLEMQELTHNFFKVIITSRTNYFACAETEPYLDTRYVSYFNEEQVKHFFKMNYGRKWEKYWDILTHYKQLSDLSRRVIVLNYLNEDILRSIQSDEEQGIEINNYQIYTKIVTNILSRLKERTADKLLPPSHALEIMSLLGFYIVCCNGETQIHYEVLGKKLLQLIEKFQLSNSKMAIYLKKEELLDNYSNLISEIRTRTFLVRDNAGYYRFAHLSFAEYYAARFILEILSMTNVTNNEIKIKLTPMVLKFLNEANKPEVLVKVVDLIKPITVFRKNSTHLSEEDVRTLINRYDFYDRYYNADGRGYINYYLSKNLSGNEVIFDIATGLMWQQSGSSNRMVYEDTKKYISEVNEKRFAGFSDWRLPTLEEAMSLMEPEERKDWYIDPIFDSNQWWIWTADQIPGESRAWVVGFLSGGCGWYTFAASYCVRAVRSGQSSTE